MLLALPVAAYGVATTPLLATGVLVGIALLAATIAWPLGVVGAMLCLGAIDPEFLTGGERALLPELGGLDMGGIRLIGITAGLGIVVATRQDLLRTLVGPAARWYVVALAWGAFSLLASQDPIEGLRLLLKLAYPLLVFLIVSAPERTTGDVRRLQDWALGGAALVLLLNPLVVVGGGYTLYGGEFLRVAGPGIHSNPFSFYLLVVLFLCLARLRTTGGLHYVLLGGLALIWMALTLTRITFLATMIALAVITCYVLLVSRNVRAMIVVGALGSALAALVLTDVLRRTFGFVPTVGELTGFLADPRGLYEVVRWEGREVIWAILWTVFERAPLLGSGLGTSSDTLESLLGGGVAHNEYLRLTVDIGILGCVLYFVAILGWIRAVVDAIRSASSGRAAEEFAVPALALVAAWAVIALTDNPFDYYGPFTQYVAFLVGASVVTSREAPAPVREPRTTGSPLLVADPPVPLT